MEIEIKFFDIIFMFILQLGICWKSMYHIRTSELKKMSNLDLIKVGILTWKVLLNIFTFPILYVLFIKNEGIISTLNLFWKLRSYTMADFKQIINFNNIVTFILDYIQVFMWSSIIIILSMVIILVFLELVCPIKKLEDN